MPASVAYVFTIAHDEGRTDHFDGNGNLVARTDRFGNRTDLTWRSLGGGKWAPTSVVDAYGLTTTFSYTTLGRVTITAPAREDGIRAGTVVAWDGSRRVTTVTDPNKQVLRFTYADVAGSSVQLLTQVQSPAGAKAFIFYQQVDYSPTDQFPALTAVDRIVTTDGSNRPVAPASFFSMDPDLPAPADNAEHNYVGYPTYPPPRARPGTRSSPPAARPTGTAPHSGRASSRRQALRPARARRRRRCRPTTHSTASSPGRYTPVRPTRPASLCRPKPGRTQPFRP